MDFYPDISVGRVPVSTEDEATTIINKIITYQKEPGENYSQTADFLQLGACSYLDPPTSGGVIKDSCIEVSVFGLYDIYYEGTTPHDLISRQACLDSINNGFYMINHQGHGYIQCIYVDAYHPHGSEMLNAWDIENLSNAPSGV